MHMSHSPRGAAPKPQRLGLLSILGIIVALALACIVIDANIPARVVTEEQIAHVRRHACTST